MSIRFLPDSWRFWMRRASLPQRTSSQVLWSVVLAQTLGATPFQSDVGETIQDRIDRAAAAGGGVVMVPAGVPSSSVRTT